MNYSLVHFQAVLESKWPSGDVSHGQILWTKLRNALLAIHMLKKLGKEGNGEFKASIRAQQQQMQLQYENQQKQEFKPKYDSKGELDNMSGSSFESGISGGSSSNDEKPEPKSNFECSESFQEASNHSEEKNKLNIKEFGADNHSQKKDINDHDTEKSNDEVLIPKDDSAITVEKSDAQVLPWNHTLV